MNTQELFIKEKILLTAEVGNFLSKDCIVSISSENYVYVAILKNNNKEYLVNINVLNNIPESSLLNALASNLTMEIIAQENLY